MERDYTFATGYSVILYRSDGLKCCTKLSQRMPVGRGGKKVGRCRHPDGPVERRYVLAHIPTAIEKGAFNAVESYRLNDAGEGRIPYQANARVTNQ